MNDDELKSLVEKTRRVLHELHLSGDVDSYGVLCGKYINVYLRCNDMNIHNAYELGKQLRGLTDDDLFNVEFI